MELKCQQAYRSTWVEERDVFDVVAVDDLEGGAGAGQHEAIDDGGRSIEDEEEPEQLVHSLAGNVLPHEAVDQGFIAAMGLVEQQLWGRILRRKCCRCTNSVPLSGNGNLMHT